MTKKTTGKTNTGKTAGKKTAGKTVHGTGRKAQENGGKVLDFEGFCDIINR